MTLSGLCSLGIPLVLGLPGIPEQGRPLSSLEIEYLLLGYIYHGWYPGPTMILILGGPNPQTQEALKVLKSEETGFGSPSPKHTNCTALGQFLNLSPDFLISKKGKILLVFF